MPSTATPELKEPRRVAGLSGHKLLIVEGSVLRKLKTEKVSLAKLKRVRAGGTLFLKILAMAMGLLFKLLAPMRNVSSMENCARGIDAMAREESAYWLGHGDALARTPPGVGGIRLFSAN